MALTAYDVLRRPLVTEKTNFHVNKLHQYVFEVAGAATKVQVKEAVEKLVKVSVASVNTMVVPGSAFGPGGEGHVRCSYATSYDNIAEALLRMGNFMRRHG